MNWKMECILFLICWVVASSQSESINSTFDDSLDDTVEILPRKNYLLDWGFPLNQRPPPSVDLKECDTCTCGLMNKDSRIVGGKETKVNQYPWIAMLLYRARLYCGASLINDRYVLTATHCVNDYNSSFITVRLLAHNTEMSSPDQIDRKVKNVVQHANYGKPVDYNNDISLILLDEPVKLNDLLRPVCLPTPKKRFTGKTGIVAGWGKSSENGSFSDTLQEVEVPIISNAVCQRTKYGSRRITDNMLCAGYPEGMKDSCQGDSGGPLHILDNGKYQIVGVVSFGEGCGEPDYPGVYSRVNRYGKWIKANTKDACYC